MLKPQKKGKYTPNRNHRTVLTCSKTAQTKIETGILQTVIR